MSRRVNFFHGTRAHLQTGDMIQPASRVPGGKVNWEGTSDPEWAYALTRSDHAMDYADASHQEGDPVVYKVRSMGDHEPDPHEDSRGEYVRSRTGFKVVGRVRKPESRR